jgi:acyl-CoA thioesterase
LAGGYAQGHAYMWSEEGRLLATASQSMSFRPVAG